MGIPWIQNVNKINFATTQAVAQLVRNASGLTGSFLFSRRGDISKNVSKMFRRCCTNETPTIPSISGNFQSPIDIIKTEAVRDDALANNPIHLPTSSAIFTLTNTGTSLNAESEQEFLISGGPLENPFRLVGFHFHWVKDNEYWSEHTVDGQAYSGELHLVHLNRLKYRSVEEALNYPDGLCVLGVFLQSENADHKELGMLTKYFESVKYKSAAVTMKEPFCPYSLLPSDRKSYWTYPGSLTTPPFSECVTWVVYKDAIPVSPSQMLDFRNLKPATAEDAQDCEKNQRSCPETTTNARDTYPVVKRVVKSTF